MACDGDIDDREIEAIRELAEKDMIFGSLDFSASMKTMTEEINAKGFGFLKEYLETLDRAYLSEEDQFKVVNVAIKTIEADDKIEYSEIKFFKILRSKLSLSNEEILGRFPGKEQYVEQDIISRSYLERLQTDFFVSSEEMPALAISAEQLGSMIGK